MSAPQASLRPTRAQRAREKRNAQQAANASFAEYLQANNLPIPDTLRSSNNTAGSSRPRKRRRTGEEGIGGLEGDHPFLNDPEPGPATSSRPLSETRTGTDSTSTTSSNIISFQNPHLEPLRPAAAEANNSEVNDTFLAAGLAAQIPELRTTAEFIQGLRSARLEDSKMDSDDIECLRNPPNTIADDFTERHFIKAIRSFLATVNASEATYNDFRAASMDCYPDDPFLSFKQVRRRVEIISGVSPIYHDMCPDTCAAFTGPYSELTECPVCSSPRYHPGTQNPRRQFITIPVGPVIQALYRSEDTADQMHYWERKIKETLDSARANGGAIPVYDDTACGQDYLNAWQAGTIKQGDVLLQLSLDGAQLYHDKESDCWIFIYIFHNLPPNSRYKKLFVIPGGFIGGPKKPKHTDSYLYPALYHIAAIQKEGLVIWDASTKTYVRDSTVLVAFVTADGPAMANMTGMVGHSGKFGCRLYCAMPGRHREGDPHYYPVMQQPHDYQVSGCNHIDITLGDMHGFRQGTQQRYTANLHKLLTVPNNAQFKKERLATGLAKQTIFSGLPRSLDIPNIFVMDIMHLIALNDPDLLIGLWRGTIKVYTPDSKDSWDWVVLVGAVWEAHGKTVAMATPYLPSSFDRAPRNIAEKINSGYKAWEFVLYLFGLGPALLHSILPNRYWSHYCKFVRGVLLLYQKLISQEHVKEGHHLLCEFAQEFESLYVRRKAQRIHFVRQSVHLPTHIAPETIRAGPLISYSQWTMETLIGNIGREIRQDKDPYANISQRGLLRAQLNALRNIIPGLVPPHDDIRNPSSSKDLGDGYILLHARQSTLVDVSPAEASAIMALWESEQWPNQSSWPRAVKRWARLRIPNGQVVRSRWMEQKSKRSVRRTTIVKFRDGNDIRFADIHYFFRIKFGSIHHTLAVATLFTEPDADMFKSSHSTVCSCKLSDDVKAFHVKAIEALVSMVPFFKVAPDGTIITPENEFFLVEKPGLEITQLLDPVDEEDSDNDEDFDTN
ncbi:hypothetical protein LshimejAT787_1401750 [Lyophyllum shimeji]|uniref:Transposase family Tnp2 protein n=1 Tax=Lyophyllum shimeji TaxID=47721 RepID=A0A9P3PX98_LYOSH|nr:hypothetical protein LshimejAT787_1401750 [Lyophyllum shimeji]